MANEKKTTPKSTPAASKALSDVTGVKVESEAAELTVEEQINMAFGEFDKQLITLLVSYELARRSVDNIEANRNRKQRNFRETNDRKYEVYRLLKEDEEFASGQRISSYQWNGPQGKRMEIDAAVSQIVKLMRANNMTL